MSDVTPSLDQILDRELAEPAEAAPVADAATDAGIEAPAEAPAPPAEGAVNPYAAELEKVRREAQNLRARTKQYEDTFGSYSEDDQKTLLALVRAIREDPATADDWWKDNVTAALKGQQGPAAQEKAEQVVAAVEAAAAVEPPAPAPASSGLTREELLSILDERDREANNARFLADYEKTANQLGFDSDSPFYAALCHVAANRTGGDVNKANEMLREMGREFFGATPEARQAVIDEFVAEKAGKADSTLPGTSTAPVPVPTKPRSLKEADKMVKAWLEEQNISGSRGR